MFTNLKLCRAPSRRLPNTCTSYIRRGLVNTGPSDVHYVRSYAVQSMHFAFLHDGHLPLPGIDAQLPLNFAGLYTVALSNPSRTLSFTSPSCRWGMYHPFSIGSDASRWSTSSILVQTLMISDLPYIPLTEATGQSPNTAYSPTSEWIYCRNIEAL